MTISTHNLLLADDDTDDCIFFKDAVDSLSQNISLTTVNDGVALMAYLNSNTNALPDMLFLDLNMPKKNGMECLSEIKETHTLKKLPVIIFSTSIDMQVVNLLYSNGAQYYIRKPADFTSLKNVINKAINIASANSQTQPTQDEFIIYP